MIKTNPIKSLQKFNKFFPTSSILIALLVITLDFPEKKFQFFWRMLKFVENFNQKLANLFIFLLSGHARGDPARVHGTDALHWCRRVPAPRH